jgi:hypothetical protein
VRAARTRGRHLQIGLTTQEEKGEVSSPTNPGKLIFRTVPLEEAGDVIAEMTTYATLGSVVVDRF